jgi:hypothetical protein
MAANNEINVMYCLATTETNNPYSINVLEILKGFWIIMLRNCSSLGNLLQDFSHHLGEQSRSIFRAIIL